jgi:hypothetical protein
MKFKPEYFWLAIFAICFLAFQFIQDNIRPNYSGDNPTLQYVLGVAPNFFPSIGIPALFVVVIPLLNSKKQTNNWVDKYLHLTANAISQTGLISWEFIQISTKNGRFDWNDILWTVLGGIIFHLIWMMSPLRFNKNKLNL